MKTSTLLTIFVLLPAADAGPIDANLSHCDGGFSDRIVETFSSSADATTPQLQLAERHGGSGPARKNTAKDFKEALPLNLRVPTLRQLLRSAKSGQPYAQTELGWRYCKGIGVERHYATAIGWYLQAAEQGHSAAQHKADNQDWENN